MRYNGTWKRIERNAVGVFVWLSTLEKSDRGLLGEPVITFGFPDAKAIIIRSADYFT